MHFQAGEGPNRALWLWKLFRWFVCSSSLYSGTLRSSSQTQLSQLRGNTSGCPTLQHQITPWPDPGPGLPVNIISGLCEGEDVENCAVTRATLPLVVRCMLQVISIAIQEVKHVLDSFTIINSVILLQYYHSCSCCSLVWHSCSCCVWWIDLIR